MTKIKLCGLTRPEDIEAVNSLKPDLIGFVFAKKSKRYVEPERAKELKQMLEPAITAVGVFVNEDIDAVAGLLEEGIIDMAQLHGAEDDDYIEALRERTGKPIIKAFRMDRVEDPKVVLLSKADHILLDSGAGTGTVFDWERVRGIDRPFFLAGGLYPENVDEAVRSLHPYGVDVSSGIETDGKKDKAKMAAFVAAVREEDKT